MASEMMEAIVQMMRDMEATDYYETGDFAAMREYVDQMSQAQAVSEGVTFTPCVLNGVETERAERAEPREDVVALYLHGGAFITGNAVDSRGYASDLADVTGCPVYSLSYRLCPEHPFPAAPEDCFTVYRALLEMYPTARFVLLGESAGGTLVLDVVLMARDAGLRLPALLCMFSPVTEIAEDLHSRQKNKDTDYAVRACVNDDIKKLYCPGVDAKNVLISPIRADFTGFPPMQITVDAGEVLLDDAVLLAEKARQAGVDVYFTLFEGCFHAFPAGGKLSPESRRVLDETAALIERHCR